MITSFCFHVKFCRNKLIHVLWILQLLVIANWIKTSLMALFYLWCMTLWPAAILIDFLLHCTVGANSGIFWSNWDAANERNMRGPGVTSHKSENNGKNIFSEDSFPKIFAMLNIFFWGAFVTCQSAQRLPLLPMIVDAEPIGWDTWDGDSAISSPFLAPKNCRFATFCETNVLSGNIYSWFQGHLN